MKKQKKFLVQILIFLIIIMAGCKVFAVDISSYVGEMKISEDFQKYTELSDEEKEKVIAPRMYDIPKNKIMVTNPLKLNKMLGTTLDTKYSLKDVIPANMVVKNQQRTNSCWAFASLGTLESTLALMDYKNQKSPIVYDFSERHMEYATSRTFLNNAINDNGFNRKVGDGGNSYLYIPYLTNGSGAISETEMPFENNEDSIYISEIQNKDVITQVNDIITFPAYSSTDDKTQIKQQIKEHIKNYGGVYAGIHGASLSDTTCYNKETGAIYCNNSITYPVNHAVVIIGWDDNYSKENFVENKRPENNGAWIIRNSWGTGEQYTLSEMKEYIFENFPEDCADRGWTDATQIPDDITTSNFENWGYTIDENNVATLKIGDNGFMYVSYEDVNVYSQLTGIVDAQSGSTYENIYQYDQYGGALSISFTTSKIYLATVFDKKTTASEYLTQVSIMAPETYTCKVYVNPNGTSKAMSDLQQVQLKAGESETFDAGYHTIEFLNPIQITGDKFVVVLEIQGSQTNSNSVMMEFNYGEFFGDSASASDVGHIYDNVTVESGKCFWSIEEGVSANEWMDASTTYEATSGEWPNFDTTIKAFTTSKVLESIEITTPPTKTSYIVGEDFDATGMVVKVKYADGTSEVITDYSITNGTNLALGQTSVTISYKGKTTTQAIEVVENSIESISIKNPPTKTEYIAGDDFDATGMEIEATYQDGTTKTITDYTIKDGKNLKNGQTTVTIEYEGKAVTQAITVQSNPVEKIEIKQAPDKVNYVEGQNFNTTGMIVEVTYENGTVKQVEDYTVQDGTNLQLDQTTVTIEYEGKTATQAITVEAKTVTAISVKTMPTKTEYIQNKEELDLTGGIIEITYNDDSTEEMSMTSEEITVSGFNNKEIGTNTITLTYKEKTTQFNIEIKEEAKPQNSNFDNMQGNVTKIKAYYFSDPNTKEYAVISVELTDISIASGNEKMEYYYYLSSNPQETNITNWVKISNLDNTDNKLSFEINTSDISNYEEISNADKLYLYIKEVATLNNMQQEEITSALQLEATDVNFEMYFDGEKILDTNSDTIVDSTPGEEIDNTIAPTTLPKAGKNILIFGLILILIVIGRITYLRYKDIEIKP